MVFIYEIFCVDIIVVMKVCDVVMIIVFCIVDVVIKCVEMDMNKLIDDVFVFMMLCKVVKNFVDVNVEFVKGGCVDLIVVNENEIWILEKYLLKNFDVVKVE